jgi:hypothetical protein
MSRELTIFQISHCQIITHRLVSLVAIVLRVILNLAGEKFNFTILYALVIPFGIAVLIWILLKICERLVMWNSSLVRTDMVGDVMGGRDINVAEALIVLIDWW